MKLYKVISRYSLGDGKYMDPPNEVALSDEEGQRLTRAGCVVPLAERNYEKAIKTTPEKRGRKWPSSK